MWESVGEINCPKIVVGKSIVVLLVDVVAGGATRISDRPISKTHPCAALVQLELRISMGRMSSIRTSTARIWGPRNKSSSLTHPCPDPTLHATPRRTFFMFRGFHTDQYRCGLNFRISVVRLRSTRTSNARTFAQQNICVCFESGTFFQYHNILRPNDARTPATSTSLPNQEFGA